MEKYLTAEQAYELAANWQETKILEAVEKTLKIIEEIAKKGLFYAAVRDPSIGTYLDRDAYVEKMKNLGYKYDGTNSNGDYIYWGWNKRKN